MGSKHRFKFTFSPVEFLRALGSQSGECVATYSGRLAMARSLSWVLGTFTSSVLKVRMA